MGINWNILWRLNVVNLHIDLLLGNGNIMHFQKSEGCKCKIEF